LFWKRQVHAVNNTPKVQTQDLQSIHDQFILFAFAFVKLNAFFGLKLQAKVLIMQPNLFHNFLMTLL
jgi:hypothetical protein